MPGLNQFDPVIVFRQFLGLFLRMQSAESCLRLGRPVAAQFDSSTCQFRPVFVASHHPNQMAPAAPDLVRVRAAKQNSCMHSRRRKYRVHGRREPAFA